MTVRCNHNLAVYYLVFTHIIFIYVYRDLKSDFELKNIFNQENGGLDPDSIYYYEQATDYFILDDFGRTDCKKVGIGRTQYYHHLYHNFHLHIKLPHHHN